MSNVSNRFTFRGGKTYLTGYPKWTGVHDLNDPVYSGYDTLYIGPETPDQNQYFIIGPTCATPYAPKLSIYDVYTNSSVDYGILPPGLTVFTFYSDGSFVPSRPSDTPNILTTLTQYRTELNVKEDAITPKIIPVMSNQSIKFNFQDNEYQPESKFKPTIDITYDNPWTPILILPICPSGPGTLYTVNGYKDPGAFVYIDGVEQAEEFEHSFGGPVLYDYGPRRHYQSTLSAGQNWYDTCYHFRSVNLTGKTDPTGPN